MGPAKSGPYSVSKYLESVVVTETWQDSYILNKGRT